MKTCFVKIPSTSSGIWLNDSPLNGNFPLLLIQICVVVTLSYSLRLLLRPLGQPTIVSQILTGIIIGPTVLGKTNLGRALFDRSRTVQFKLIGVLGLIFFQFMIGVKADVGRLRKAGKKAAAIGFSGFLVPLLFAYVYRQLKSDDFDVQFSDVSIFYSNVTFWCSSSIVVISCLLSELNLLNSKIGRLAVASSLVETFVETTNRAATNIYFITAVAEDSSTAAVSIVSFVGLILLILYGARPLAVWVVRQTPKGETLHDAHFLIILMMAVVSGFLSALVGHSLAVGAFYVGLALPSGPPLGSTFVERLEGLVSMIFFPIFISMIGLETDFTQLGGAMTECMNLQVTNILLHAGKIIGIVVPALLLRMPLYDAITLVLIMSTRGISEISKLFRWVDEEILNGKVYTVQLLNILFMAAITAPLLRVMYKPSKRYKGYKLRSIQNSKNNVELRFLACIHNEESVPPCINLLEAVCAREANTAIYVLHMMQLVGRVDTVLVPYKKGKSSHGHGHGHGHATANTDRIFNAFQTFDQRNAETTTVLPYISISPYTSMYEDVCSLALDMKVSMVILPFHKMEVDGTVESDNQALRAVNNDVLSYAPCSIGILIDHGQIKDIDAAMTNVIHNVGVYFFGGADDREAVALTTRLAMNRRVSVTLIRFVAAGGEARDEVEVKLDNATLYEYKVENVSNKNLVYREETVADGEEMFNVVLSTSTAFDLLVVGKRSGTNSVLTEGLSTWSEYPELGIIGDLLASSDSVKHASTLVVQQQTSGGRRKLI